MNLVGPKSITSILHVLTKIAFWWSALGVLAVAIIPILPSNGFFAHGARQYLSFEARSGLLSISIPVFHDGVAKWWLWAMLLAARLYKALFFFLLMRILEPIRAGDPFHSKLPSRLWTMGCVVVIGSVLRTIALASLSTGNEVGFWARAIAGIDTDAIFMGFVVVILGEVFRRGYSLKSESELTV